MMKVRPPPEVPFTNPDGSTNEEGVRLYREWLRSLSEEERATMRKWLDRSFPKPSDEKGEEK